MHLLFSSSFSALFWDLFFYNLFIPPCNNALSLAEDCENEHTSVTIFQIAKIWWQFKTPSQGITGGNKKAGVHSKRPEWLFHSSLKQFTSTKGCRWQFDAVTRCGQILQTQGYLNIRDMLESFSVATPKIMAWPAVQHCRSYISVWSISPCQFMNFLNWRVNCIQEQFVLPLVHPGF